MADDVLHGGSADDTIVGTDADENLSGGAGDDTIDGAGGDDKISGGSSDDYLIGGTGNDTLNGSSGNDTLDGGSGNDQLNGDAGYDTAVYNGSVFDYSFSISSPSSTITDANLSDGDDGTDTLKDVEEVQFADATIYLDGRNNDPLVAADYLFMQEDQSLSVAFADQLANDLGVEGDTITLESVGNAVNGTVSLDGSGNVVFTPNSDFSGTASFEYTVSDGQGGFNSGTVTVEVEAVADAPNISTTDASGTEDTAIALDLSAALSDTDGSESPAQIKGLKITPAVNYDEEFTLTVTATSTEASSGNQASTVTILNVAVAADADAPVVSVSGSELSGTVGWSYQPEHVVVEGVGGTTDIAVLADGGHIVVYSKGGIVARRYGVDGNPVGSEFVIDDVGGGGIWPSVAARDDGGFVITWSGGDVDGK